MDKYLNNSEMYDLSMVIYKTSNYINAGHMIYDLWLKPSLDI